MTEFEFKSLKKVVAETPELLFKGLKKSQGVTHAWAQQADSWREYIGHHVDTPDLAFELPTGSGKTLIGLVLGEWRRKKFNEKVLYLCPNNQLADQVAAHAQSYGIKAAAMGKDRYDALPDYFAGELIAISSYKGLFNTNPKFKNPDVIILDDAHSAEDSIGSLWSVLISRKENAQLHQAILSLYREEIQDAAYYVLNPEAKGSDRYRTYGLAHPLLWNKKDSLYSLLDSQAENSSWQWEWSLIKDKLHACQMFYSWGEILIRPIIAPTTVHKPFAGAKQRIYMSATLGAGGELERITGIEKITRVPLGNQVENTGRRLFLFTNPKLPEKKTPSLLSKAIREHKRALVLTPTYWEADQLTRTLQDHGVQVIDSQKPAAALSTLANATNVALVFPNRYDGIDLPNDKCRLLVMSGKPGGSNLFERFLITGLNASTVLRDRMRTRFVQGIGRCCRGEGDYAAILVVGSELHEFCADNRIMSAISPDLQAEIAFGLSQSTRDEFTTEQPFLDLIKLLMDRGDKWDRVENHLLSETKEMEKIEDPASAILVASVAKEVRYQYELLKKNYEFAYKLALDVATALKSTKKLDGYRSWWLYLAASALWLEAVEADRTELKAKVSELLSEASSCTNSVAWFSEINQFLNKTSSDVVVVSDVLDKKQTQEALSQLKTFGLYDSKFDTKMTEMLAKINENDHSAFHEGVQLLGKNLGFTAHLFSEHVAPDCIWELARRECLIFEAKSEEKDQKEISHGTAKQALAQRAWVLNKLGLAPETTETTTVVLSPRTTINSEAQVLLNTEQQNEVHYQHMNDIRKLAEVAADCLRQVRSLLKKGGEEESLHILQEEFAKKNLLFSQLKETFRSVPLQSLKNVAVRYVQKN